MPSPSDAAAPEGARGLTSAEAAARLRRHGPNELARAERFALLRALGRQVANPLVLILLVASALSAGFGQVVSAAVIVLMVALSLSLNFAQAYRSQAAVERLRAQVGQTATVWRDGVEREIPCARWCRGTSSPCAQAIWCPPTGGS